MQIAIELDLPAIIAQAVSAERIQPIVDKAVSTALKEAIEEATGYRSDFRAALKKQIGEAIPHGLAIDEVAKFQHMANAAVIDAVGGANAATIKAAIAAGLKAAIPDVPERIKLSELINEARSGFHKERHEAFYAHFKPSEYSSIGGGWLALDSNEDTRGEYSASIRLAINGSGAVYALKLGGRDITPKSVPDAVGRFDGLLLSMYVGRTSVDIDIDQYEVESAAGDQYD